MKKIVIIGAGGFGREILWTLRDCNKVSKKYDILGFIDNDEKLKNQNICDIPVLGNFEWFSKQTEIIYAAISIGDPKIRKSIVNQLKFYKLKFPTVIHPSVINSEYIKIGNGTIIQAGCILTTNIEIKEFVHININSTIGHGCIVDDFVTISPGSHINGESSIGEGTYVGSGVVANDEIDIGKWSIIGAGSVVINNVKSNSVYVGNPSKLLKKINSKNRPKL